ncbi:MAG: hypothetical protein L0387_41410 [Acidobacteria bacterium]|nr:hypothetical protein [Acidobacteriota bacterium]MCI0718048.1 hypothetical protein [Acidobacteriota bacterium]
MITGGVPGWSPVNTSISTLVDARQMPLFGAGWTAGSVKHLAEAGASLVTHCDTSAWRGVMETEKGSRLLD